MLEGRQPKAIYCDIEGGELVYFKAASFGAVTTHSLNCALMLAVLMVLSVFSAH